MKNLVKTFTFETLNPERMDETINAWIEENNAFVSEVNMFSPNRTDCEVIVALLYIPGDKLPFDISSLEEEFESEGTILDLSDFQEEGVEGKDDEPEPETA